jgi:hypothetical protein
MTAEIKLGEYLKATPKATGGEHGGRVKEIDGTREEPSNPTPTLAELGISKKLSSEAQRLADLRDLPAAITAITTPGANTFGIAVNASECAAFTVGARVFTTLFGIAEVRRDTRQTPKPLNFRTAEATP